MGDSLQVQQSAMFKRAYKRLHPSQKADVDDAVADIVRDPTIGGAKKGDLAGVFVHKFKCNSQPTLLAYEYNPKRWAHQYGRQKSIARPIQH